MSTCVVSDRMVFHCPKDPLCSTCLSFFLPQPLAITDFFFFFLPLHSFVFRRSIPFVSVKQSNMGEDHFHLLCCLFWSCSTCLVTQSCLTLCDPMDCSPPGLSVYEDSPGKNTGVGYHALLQGIFPTQGLSPALLHRKRILYCVSHQGSLFGPRTHFFLSFIYKF